MERAVDFWRDRYMLCGQCGHRWKVDLEWIDRFDQGSEQCPGCGTSCEAETTPRVTVDTTDPALGPDVAKLFWYHTSTQPDWPAFHFDPAAALTPQTRLLMGGDEHVDRWVVRQRAKALHVGTYEAAIHNMFRRIVDQADHGQQFYLYRVHLVPSVKVRSGWVIDPSDFVGDVILEDVCPPGVDVVRYVNYHEDPGGLSLALGRSAIASTQRMAIPLHLPAHLPWAEATTRELECLPSATPTDRPRRFGRSISPRAERAHELVESYASRLPVTLRSQFAAATRFADDINPAPWTRYVEGLAELILTPSDALARVDPMEGA